MKRTCLKFSMMLLLAVPLLHTTTRAGEDYRWSDGHGDFAVNYLADAWKFSIRVDAAPKPEYAPDNLVIVLRDNSRTAIPANPNFAFLGDNGDPIWIIPSVQQLGIPFMGASHELTPSGTFINNRFDLKLSSVDGPGDFILWTVAGGGQPTVLMSSRDGITEADNANAPAPGHWHQNWGFTAPGTYRVGFTASGILVNGGQTVSSEEAVYTFEVGVLSSSEADIEVAYEDGELEFHVHNETTDTEFNPTHVALHAGPPAWQTVPEDPLFAFLGAAGNSIHVFPQDENENVLFLGLAGGEIEADTFVNDTVQVQLTVFDGPGEFYYYEVDAFGAPTVRFNTVDGLSEADVVSVLTGAHAHRNWAFSAPGVYRVTLVATGDLSVGGTITSEPMTFLFEVFGPEFFDHGEIDLEIGFDNGAFELVLLDETVEKEFCAANAVLVGRAPATTTVPENPAFSFLGNPGDVVHILPQEEAENILFLGIATDEIGNGQFVGETVQLQLAALEGPGNLAVYSIDTFGAPTVYWNSADGLIGPDSYPAAVGSHAHNNWAFTAPGVYRVGLKAVGALVSGNQLVESEIVTFTFQIKAPVRFEDGEIDFEIVYEEGEWEMGLLNEAAEKEYETDETLLVAVPAAIQTVPNNPAFSFLGTPGSATHVLPQEEAEGVLFLGIAGDEITPGQFVGETVNLKLVSATGPGNFSLYSVDQFGAPIVFMNTGDSAAGEDVYPLAVGNHSHVNWAFSAAGEYELEFKAAGTLVDGNTLTESEPLTLTFLVEAGGPVLTYALVNGGTEFQISWPSQTGVSYQLQSRINLSIPGWKDEGAPIPGTAGELSGTVPKTTDTLKVFQVVEIP